jgi:multicopper oxidase
MAAPDGFERSVLHVNGQYPGPLIRGRLGEQFVIALKNSTIQGITNHYHGQYQLGTYRMDGVPNVTQPQLPGGKTFHVDFTAAPGGTFWYHSHEVVENEYPDGQYGPLIVDDPERDELWSYNQEETLLFNDWFHRTSSEILERLINPPKGEKNIGYPGGGDLEWVSALVNGKGRYKGGPAVPLTVVDVEPGAMVRFRLINASSTYELWFSIDEHDFTVIAADGTPIKPIKGNQIRMAIGERYDLLVPANKDGVHWIRIATSAGAEGLAILKYKGSAKAEPEPRPYSARSRQVTRSQMRSLIPFQVPTEPLHRVPVKLGGTMNPYRWSMNGEYYPNASELIIKRGEHVRVILENPTMMSHPFHLHGHSFRILGDPKAPLLTDPPLVDMVLVPPNKSVAIQFDADNPGKWIFHCHIDWHLATGMARVFRYESIDNDASKTFLPGSVT